MKGMILRVFVGAVAALLAWALMEPLAPHLINDPKWDTWELSFVAVLGLFVGAGVGAVTGLLTGGKMHTLRGLIFGAVLGAIGITLGSKIGGTVSVMMFGQGALNGGNVVVAIPARVVALTPIGMLLGLAIGISTLSPQRAKYGLIGGTIAGAVGGGVFDLIGEVTGAAIRAARQLPTDAAADVGSVSRATYAVILGAGIALFISIVETLAKSAWLRQELGRNEGREWPLYSDLTTIGRSETATVPIFGDPAVQPFHATISRLTDGYMVTDNGGGIAVNGQQVAQAPLISGSVIQLGNTRLKFMMKDGAPAMAPQQTYSQVPPAPASTPAAAMTQMPTMQQGAIPTQAMPGQQQAMIPTQAMPAAQPAGPTIVATDGPLIGQRFTVAFPFEVGRTCPTIPMNFDTMASRRHASLAPAPGGVMVTDLGSTNGTFVNGAKVQQALAGPGQTIKIGSTTFRVE